MKPGKPVKTPNPFLFTLYRSSLRLYPWRLRLLYQDQLLRRHAMPTATQLPASPSGPLSLPTAQIRRQGTHAHNPRPSHSAPHLLPRRYLEIILTISGGFADFLFQGLLRRGANEPQAQMAALYASRIASGIKPDEAIPSNYVDLERSLEPFVIFYNDQGAPLTATVFLNQAIPTPPSGVFNYLRSHPTDTITWQPQPNVRIAAVIHRVSGPHSGYLLSGAIALGLVEEQEAILRKMVFGGWFLIVFLLFAGAIFLSRLQQPPTRLVRAD